MDDLELNGRIVRVDSFDRDSNFILSLLLSTTSKHPRMTFHIQRKSGGAIRTVRMALSLMKIN